MMEGRIRERFLFYEDCMSVAYELFFEKEIDGETYYFAEMVKGERLLPLAGTFERARVAFKRAEEKANEAT